MSASPLFGRIQKVWVDGCLSDGKETESFRKVSWMFRCLSDQGLHVCTCSPRSIFLAACDGAREVLELLGVADE